MEYPEARKVKNHHEEMELLSNFLKEQFKNKKDIQLLEAGCGQYSDLNLFGLSCHITGVDLDKDALQERKNKGADLDELIVGDLRKIKLNYANYDVIYNSFVLEHIEGAENVLNRFFSWLKPHGVLILRIPERNSAYGLLTRLTPHWIHVLYKKYVTKNQNAGKSGFGPYPTFYDKVVSKDGILKYCNNNHHTIKEVFVANYYLSELPSYLQKLTNFILKIIELLSLRKLTSKYNNLTFIIEKENHFDKHNHI